jgi:hypothetical protein|tara:strand:- start:422 stop:775 length:354 start_codon:yes stop_codon:yes gene_type:complete
MKKKKQNNKDQRELFDTKKFERTYLLPQTWYELLSNSDEEFLNELLFDISGVNYIYPKLILTFQNPTSYNFFHLSMLNENSKRKIERIFKGIYGDDVLIVIQKANTEPPGKIDNREL